MREGKKERERDTSVEVVRQRARIYLLPGRLIERSCHRHRCTGDIPTFFLVE